MSTFIGTVTEVIDGKGIYVEMSTSGMPARYGPMLYVTSDGIPVFYASGDRVLVMSVGRIADNFIIVGKVIDPGNPPYNQPQLPQEEP